MGQFLFWLEAAITSVLLVALGLALVSRTERRGRRWFVRILWGILTLLPWLVVIGAFATVQIWAGGAVVPLILSAVAGIAFLVVTIVVIKRGRKVSALTDGPAAATWRLNRLALAWVAALLLTCMTFWNLDLAVQQEMGTLRVEAGAVALSIAPPRMPESQNAAVLYRQAWNILDAHNDENRKWDKAVAEWLHPSEGEFNPDNEQMLAFLKRSQPVIGLLRKAAELPGCNFGTQYNPPSVALVLPTLGRMRDLNRLLCLSSRVAANEGKMTEAMADMHAAWALAEHSTAEPALIASLVAFAAEGQAFETFQYLLERGKFTSDSLKAGPDTVAVSYRDALHRSMRMETAFGVSIFTMLDPSAAFTTASIPGPRDYVTSDASALYRVFLWDKDVEAYLWWMRRYERLSSQPYHESAREWRNPPQTTRRNGKGGLLATIFIPSFSRAAGRAAIADAQRRLVTLGIAMWRCRLAEGSFPRGFDQLVPQYILTTPIDPFTGQSMKMAETAHGVAIYSVGPDLNDDESRSLDPKTMKGDVSLMLGK